MFRHLFGPSSGNRIKLLKVMVKPCTKYNLRLWNLEQFLCTTHSYAQQTDDIHFLWFAFFKDKLQQGFITVGHLHSDRQWHIQTPHMGRHYAKKALRDVYTCVTTMRNTFFPVSLTTVTSTCIGCGQAFHVFRLSQTDAPSKYEDVLCKTHLGRCPQLSLMT
jgi:hypothetical protein